MPASRAYDPWDHLSRLACRDQTLRLSMRRLPEDFMGLYDFLSNTIHLDVRLTPVEARCTLAHELVHYERRDDPRAWRRRGLDVDAIEREVHAVASQRLITGRALRFALSCSSDEEHQAARLGVDVATLRARVASCSAV